MNDEEIGQARAFAASLNVHATTEAIAAQWIDALVDRVEWAQDELCALHDRESART